VLLAGKSPRQHGLADLLSLGRFHKLRAFLSTTTQSSCFKRPGVHPGLLKLASGKNGMGSEFVLLKVRAFKGSVSRDFLGPFSACMDRSRSV
jgi:hypothetical protein